MNDNLVSQKKSSSVLELLHTIPKIGVIFFKHIFIAFLYEGLTFVQEVQEHDGVQLRQAKVF